MSTSVVRPYEGVVIFATSEEAARHMGTPGNYAMTIDMAKAIILVSTTRYPALLEAVLKYKQDAADPSEVPPVHFALFDYKGWKVTVTKEDTLYCIRDTSPTNADDGTSCVCATWEENIDIALIRFHRIVAGIFVATA